MSADFDHSKHRAATLGSVFCGQLNRVPRQRDNKRAALVWEVPWQLGFCAQLFFFNSKAAC